MGGSSKEYKSAWEKRNPEKKKEYQKRYYSKNKEKRAAYYRFRKIGCSKEQYEKLLKRANNKCEICGKEDFRNLSVDHCHVTNKIRGVLCTACNLGIGSFKDNEELMEKAIEYLRVTK